MARQARFLSQQLDAENADHDNADEKIPIRTLEEAGEAVPVGPLAAQAFDNLEVTIAAHEARLRAMNAGYQELSERERELIEVGHVLRETGVFFKRVRLLHLSLWYWIVTDVGIGRRPSK